MPVSCPSCNASNAPEARLCTHCGQLFDASVERPAAPVESVTAPGVLKNVRVLYIVVAVFNLLGVLMMIGDGALRPAETAFQVVVTVLFGAGVVVLHRHPFFWSVLMAALMTPGALVAVVSAVTNPSPFAALVAVMAITIVGALWFASGVLFRARGQLRRYPAGSPPRLVLEAAAVVLVVAAVAFVVHSQSRPAAARARPAVRTNVTPGVPVEPRIAAFEAAWRSGDLDAIGSFYPPRHFRRASELGRRMEQRGWAGLPQIERQEIQTGRDGRRVAVYGSAAGVIRAEWQYERDAWLMTRLLFP